MEYIPRFSQPFTFSEAINLDVATITEEISRLQNSLSRLKETQAILQADLEEPGDADPEVTKAFEENKVVIGSQEERISMLKMALTDKGIISGSHYEPLTASSEPTETGASHAGQSPPAIQDQMNSSTESEGGGIFL